MARAAHCFFRDPDLDAGYEYISEAEVQVEKLLSEVNMLTVVLNLLPCEVIWSGLKKENLNGFM